ncbi:Aste57867_9175 [Aphanomyces stellatus]|uniref:Aste57867_9175 protein n=1 Tax=Aphanomyces stellatus TaxID=120398 RepID=A0A485KM74_9STRA|nr:hypothetical protein As57867_009139 [Aphanomyces stellatus]VFT86059.1 Aste57867_9175 [Aphanomyces stellatus]
MLSSARNNKASRALVHMRAPIAIGGFKVVYGGEYVDGERDGQQCVLKHFLAGSVVDEAFFAAEMGLIARALKIVHAFNVHRILDTRVWLNVPAIWTVESGWGRDDGEKALVEPRITAFRKFNSNTGWTCRDADAMQALSHFSYHDSNGCVLLCDLQGAAMKHGYVLTDPVIMSPGRHYGPTDLGRRGISTFFARHVCRRFCSPDWIRPADRNVYFDAVEGSTMQRI